MKYRGILLPVMAVALFCFAGCGGDEPDWKEQSGADAASSPGEPGSAAQAGKIEDSKEEVAGVEQEPAEVAPDWAKLTEEEWRERLSPEAFYVLRQKGTEPRYTGSYHNNKLPGRYVCAGCGTELFSSQEKYDSGTGWPSFWSPVEEENVATAADNSFFSRRTEVLCAKCDGHLGHVFDDGPAPTGLRYCINAVSLKFVEAGKKEAGKKEGGETSGETTSEP